MFKTSKRNVFISIITISITSVVLGYLIYSQREILFSYSWKIRPLFLVIAFLNYSVILFLNVLTWSNIMTSLGVKIDINTHFRSTTISALGKRIPGTFWYVWWRAEIYREKLSAKVIAFASAIEMAVTVVAAVIICTFFAFRMILQYKYSILGIFAVLIVSLGLLHPRTIQWLLRKSQAEELNISYRNLVFWIFLYMIIWILVGTLLFNINNIIVYISLEKIGYYIGAVALTGTISRLLLFFPSVFGFTEVSLSLLLSSIMPSSLAVIVAVANRILVTIFETIWALISILVSGHSIPWQR